MCLVQVLQQSPYLPSQSTTSCTFELVHSDVCGPVHITGYDCNSFFVDNFTWYAETYLLKNKSDAFQVFRHYKNENWTPMPKQVLSHFELTTEENTCQMSLKSIVRLMELNIILVCRIVIHETVLLEELVASHKHLITINQSVLLLAKEHLPRM